LFRQESPEPICFWRSQRLRELTWDSSLSHFVYRFTHADTRINLVVDGKNIVPAVVEKIAGFLKQGMPDFDARIHRILLTRVSREGCLAPHMLDVNQWRSKIIIVGHKLDEILGSYQIYVSKRFFRPSDRLDWIPVTLGGVFMMLPVGAWSIILKSKKAIGAGF
jgi:hypothetical protein